MKKKLFRIISVFILFFCFVPPISADTKTIIIEEIQFEGTKANDEFVRLKNETNNTINLAGYKLTKKISSNNLCKESALVSASHFIGTIAPHSFFTIAHQSYKNTIGADLDYSSASYYLSNNTIVLLYDSSGILLDRKSIGKACDEVVTPDPAMPPATQNPLTDYSANIRLNEILANPSGNESTDEFIEIFNTSDSVADLSSWSIKDNSASGKYVFPDNTIIQPNGFLVVYRKVFSFALNNSDETVSLLDPSGTMKDTVSYKTAYEDISYNYTSSGWRGGIPTPGAINQSNTPPTIKKRIPKSGYKNVALSFEGKGSDANHDAMKYTWDFGDGHKSYKEKTTHTYEEEGTYIITLKVTDGKDETITTSSIKIQSFPRKNVRITALLPNPAGKDTGAEQIIIRNNEKKKINLKDYSIATGWKKLVNHIIHEDLFIKAKGEAIITREHALFTLPNQKGKIELRAPGGKTLQEIHYKLEKPLAEDVWYIKEKGKRWEWKYPLKKPSANIVIKKEIFSPPASIPVKEETKEVSETITLQDEEDLEDQKKITVIRSNDVSSLHRDTSLQTLTTYGTNIDIPENILLSLSSEATLTPTEDAPRTSHTDSVLIMMNSAINAFINTL